jgi:hypothetical protein
MEKAHRNWVPEQGIRSQYFTMGEIDGNNEKGIAVAPPRGMTGSDFGDASVVCFNSKGHERWKFVFHPSIQFGAERFSNSYDAEAPLIWSNANGSGLHDILLAVHHREWWPSAIVSLSTLDGRITCVYWHPGWLKIGHQATDRRSPHQLLVSGYNNAFKKSFIAVMDPTMMGGHAPSSEGFIPQGIPQAREEYYLLLPNPDIFELANHWTEGTDVSMDVDGRVEMKLGRILPGERAGEWLGAVVFFIFDKDMRCTSVKAGDDFTSAHLRAETGGKSRLVLNQSYFQQLQESVLYWNGERFVNRATPNKAYVSK